MKNIIHYALLLVAITMLSISCSNTIYFTQRMKHQLHDQGIDLTDVQFYNSRKFTLQRNLSLEETKVAQGKIRYENGQFIEQIIIKKNTPGVCEVVNPNSLLVSFEAGDDRNLTFVMNRKEQYQLSAEEWQNKFGRVFYDTTYYFILPGGEKTLLKVKKEDIFKTEKKQRVAPGRKVTPAK